MRDRAAPWQPSEEQMRLWPSVSGNTINGVGEASIRRPSPIYWHPPETVPHGPLQKWFYAQTKSELVSEARKARQRAIDEPLAPLAHARMERTPEAWTREVQRLAEVHGADTVGIAAMRSEWVFEHAQAPTAKWIIVLGVAHDYEEIKTAPEERAAAEVSRQYGRGIGAAKGIASALRSQGWEAFPHGGPMAGDFVLIPAAIEAGLGELGKHGSLIHRELGASFRLACVLTDLPLIPNERDIFGADDFCASCRVCSDSCPPIAIQAEKTLIRGERRWYVDFDKCLPYFNENMGCAICIAVCPFSRPLIGPRLATKLATKRARELEKKT